MEMISAENIAKRRATSLKQLHRTGSPLTQQLKKSTTLSLKRTSHGFAEAESSSQSSLLTFFRRNKAVPDDADQAMAMLDAQIAQIRGDLELMRVEDVKMAARVQDVQCRLDSVSSASTVSSRNSSTNSLEMINEDESIRLEEDGASAAKGSSVGSLTSSKRDSGCVFDPVFEVDNRAISVPNNMASSLSNKGKARSTTALDFIRNNLHEDDGERLKATSCDRLSCYSDSAVLCAGRPQRFHHSFH